MADSPEQLAKLLADLESRKESLQHRLNSLDAAIQGIQSIVEPSADTSIAKSGDVVESVEVQSFPVREAVSSSLPLRAQQVNDEEFARNQRPAKRDNASPAEASRSLAEREAPLRRPVHTPAPERRKPGNLNIYVNRNAEWAARQIVPAHSTRAVFRKKTGHRCPKCGSPDTRISLTRGISDLFMFLFDYSIARCRNCDTRFRIWQTRPDDDEAQELEPQPSTK